MDPVTALERQIEAYRRMTGEERLAIALRLHELACAIAREGIRHQHPHASPQEVEQHLHRRIRLGQTLGPNRNCCWIAWGA
jgi:Rv0078B-related antitoxin